MAAEESGTATVADLRTKVQAMIGSSTPDVVNQVIDSLVKVEKDRRVALLLDGLKRYADAVAVLGKIKPDHMVFDDAGAMISTGWSANRKGERDKAKKLVDRLGQCLDTAISSGEFKTLEEALKGGQPKDD